MAWNRALRKCWISADYGRDASCRRCPAPSLEANTAAFPNACVSTSMMTIRPKTTPRREVNLKKMDGRRHNTQMECSPAPEGNRLRRRVRPAAGKESSLPAVEPVGQRKGVQDARKQRQENKTRPKRKKWKGSSRAKSAGVNGQKCLLSCRQIGAPPPALAARIPSPKRRSSLW